MNIVTLNVDDYKNQIISVSLDNVYQCLYVNLNNTVLVNFELRLQIQHYLL